MLSRASVQLTYFMEDTYYFLSKPHMIFYDPMHSKRPICFQDLETKDKMYLSEKDFKDLLQKHSGSQWYSYINSGQLSLIYLNEDGKVELKALHKKRERQKSYSFSSLLEGIKNDTRSSRV